MIVIIVDTLSILFVRISKYCFTQPGKTAYVHRRSSATIMQLRENDFSGDEKK